MRKLVFIILSFFLLRGAALYPADGGFLFMPDNANFYVYGRGADTFIINQNRVSSMQLDKQIAKLSSGLRINSASDDPAGLAVAEKMDSMLRQLRQESVNDEDMRNLHYFVESAVAQDQEIVKRIRDLILRSSGGILTAEDRGFNQTEINELLKQIDMNAKFSQFNTLSVIPDLTAAALGLDKINVVKDANGAIGLADSALEKLTVKRIIHGVKSNILTFRIEGKNWHYLNLQRAESGIRDADMTEGVSELIKNSVLLKSRYGLLLRSK